MEDKGEMIRQQMEDTRTSLTEKVEKLEKQVVGTVQDATTAVADTVEAVKETVQDTVDAVKGAVNNTVDAVKDTVSNTVESVQDAFNIPKQVRSHPLLFVGGAFGLGFAAGLFLMPRLRRGERRRPSSAAPNAAPARPEPRREPAPERRSGLLDLFGKELNMVKELAVGSLMGTLRDLAVKALPEKLAEQAKEVADSLTAKVGGKVI
jgi:ElaB/YqjD/DUF883 family membrane-anchored ribosome-binding protein